jgi:hypothetical protein
MAAGSAAPRLSLQQTSIHRAADRVRWTLIVGQKRLPSNAEVMVILEKVRGKPGSAGSELVQQARDSGAEDLARGVDGDQAFENAEVGIDGDLGVGHLDRAFDGRTEQARLRCQAEG